MLCCSDTVCSVRFFSWNSSTASSRADTWWWIVQAVSVFVSVKIHLSKYYNEADGSSWVWMQQTQGLIITCLCLMLAFPCCCNCCCCLAALLTRAIPKPVIALLLPDQAKVAFAWICMTTLKCSSWHKVISLCFRSLAQLFKDSFLHTVIPV